jgi:hypothetical protein
MAQAVSRRPLTAEAWVRFGSVHVGFVVYKVAIGQVSPRVLRFSPVNFIPPLHGKTKKLIIFITGLHNKTQVCGASVASAAGPSTKKERYVSGWCSPWLKHSVSVAACTFGVVGMIA